MPCFRYPPLQALSRVGFTAGFNSVHSANPLIFYQHQLSVTPTPIWRFGAGMLFPGTAFSHSFQPAIRRARPVPTVNPVSPSNVGQIHNSWAGCVALNRPLPNPPPLRGRGRHHPPASAKTQTTDARSAESSADASRLDPNVPATLICNRMTMICITTRLPDTRAKVFCCRGESFCDRNPLFCSRQELTCDRQELICDRQRLICNWQALICSKKSLPGCRQRFPGPGQGFP